MGWIPVCVNFVPLDVPSSLHVYLAHSLSVQKRLCKQAISVELREAKGMHTALVTPEAPGLGGVCAG